MSDEIEITCSNCKDLEGARKLIERMKDPTAGRHNSNREVPTQSPVYDVDHWDGRQERINAHPQICQTNASGGTTFLSMAYMAEVCRSMNFQPISLEEAARSLVNDPYAQFCRRVQSKKIEEPAAERVKLRMADCGVGDCVSEDRFPEWIGRRGGMANIYYFRPCPEDADHYARRWVNAFFWNQPVGELQPFEEWVFERVYCLKLRPHRPDIADPFDIATADRVFYWRRLS